MTEERDAQLLEERQARYDRIVKLKESGLSLSDIGEREGLSRQRVSRILKAGRPTIVRGIRGQRG